MKVQRNRQSAVSNRQSAFTLVELLVVIGIIAVLLGLLIPAVMSAMRGGDRSRIAAQIETLRLGLEAYKSDFGIYPIGPRGFLTTDPITRSGGAYAMAWSLAGPQSAGFDGQEGPGVRVRDRTGSGLSKVYGPYVQGSGLRIVRIGAKGTANNGVTINSASTADEDFAILDAAGSAFLYFRRNPGWQSIDPSAMTPGANSQVGWINTGGTFGEFSHWNGGQNSDIRFSDDKSFRPETLRVALGDTNANGLLDGTEISKAREDYIIWSVGPDRKSLGRSDGGTGDATVAELLRLLPKTDDVFSFQP